MCGLVHCMCMCFGFLFFFFAHIFCEWVEEVVATEHLER